jgi:protoheme IX farnesyltransferase
VKPDVTSVAIGSPSGVVARRLADYVTLTKPRVVVMVLVTTFVGYYLGSDRPTVLLLHTLVGTGLAAAGTMALNQYLERERDAKMNRTRHRPLPDGRLSEREALAVGVGLLALGLGYLAATTALLPTAITAAIAVSYLAIYTPLKGVTSLCSVVGAVPGALPPVVGWVAATGRLGLEPVVLFGIMFLWQIPHTLAIGRLYRDDYSRAGVRVLPVIDRGGVSTGVHAIAHCLALLPVALMPTLAGFAGPIYFVTALCLGLVFLGAAAQMAWRESLAAARRLMVVSLVYLPVLLGVLALDRLGPIR